MIHQRRRGNFLQTIFYKQVDIILCFHLPYHSVTPKKPQKNRLTKKDHYTAILLEEVRDQLKFIIEKVQSMEGSIRAEIIQNKAELKQDMADIQKALVLRIENVRTELKKEIQQVRTELKAEIQQVQTRLSEKIDRTHDIILRHDNEIAAMKKTA